MSTETNTGPNLRRKLLAVMQAIGGVEKKGKTEVGQVYTYQRAADIFPKTQRALIEYGVMFLAHEVARTPHPTHQSKNNAVVFVEDVLMKFIFLDTDSDERIEGEGSGIAFDTSDKALNKAKTAALKYFLKQTFLIGEDEDDSEKDTHEVFDDDARDPADSFRATADKRVTDAQALSVRTWCRSEGVEFGATFGEIFDVKEPEQMTEIQFARWVEKRRDIVESKRPKLSRDVDEAMKAADESMDRTRQQTPANGNYISEKQANRLWYMSKQSDEIINQTLAQFGFKSKREIPKTRYDEFCKEVEKAAS